MFLVAVEMKSETGVCMDGWSGRGSFCLLQREDKKVRLFSNLSRCLQIIGIARKGGHYLTGFSFESG